MKPALLALLLPVLILCGCPSRSNPVPPVPGAPQLKAATTTWPDATAEELTRGHAGVVASCNRCHGYPKVDEVSAAEWPATATKMIGRSKVAEADRQAVYRYLLTASAQ